MAEPGRGDGGRRYPHQVLNRARRCARPAPTRPTPSSPERRRRPGLRRRRGRRRAPTRTRLADLGDAYCYTVWVSSTPARSARAGAIGHGRPFNACPRPSALEVLHGPRRDHVAPPTVGLDGVLVPSNDNLVHGMTRGAGRRGLAHHTGSRSTSARRRRPAPDRPLRRGLARLLLDARRLGPRGRREDGRDPLGNADRHGWPGRRRPGRDLHRLRRRLGLHPRGDAPGVNNRFYALDPSNGAVIDYFPKVGDPRAPDSGAVTGMAAVDYAHGQVYFGTFLALAELALVPEAGPAVRRAAVRVGGSHAAVVGDIDGSPVVRSEPACTSATPPGDLWSINATDPLDRYSTCRPTRPDGRSRASRSRTANSNALYFSTTTRASHSAVPTTAPRFRREVVAPDRR